MSSGFFPGHPSAVHEKEIRGENGIIVKKAANGDTTVALDERVRGLLMLNHNGMLWPEIAFQFDDFAFSVRDIGGSALFRLFDSRGIHTAHVDLKTTAAIVEFLQAILARAAEKIMDDKQKGAP